MAAEAVLALLITQQLRKLEAAIKGRKILGLNVSFCLVPSSVYVQQDILLKEYQSKYQNLPIYFFFGGQMKIPASPLPKGEQRKHPTNT